MRPAIVLTSLLALSATLSLLGADTAQAQYTATGVYYDYAQVTMGDTAQFVLIPRETTEFQQSGPPSVTIPQAFRVLRDRKRTTYGNASLTLTDEDIARGRVVVHIDPEQRNWFLIVAAETVYTFTELGLSEVEFPGFADRPWTRDDIPFPAFVLHAPMWRVLPPAEMHAGLIQLYDGELIPADSFYERWADGDRELRDELLTYLREGTVVEQTGVLTALREGPPVPGADGAVTELLEDDDVSIRLLAVDYLTGRDDPELLDAIIPLVEGDPNPEVRAAAADALGASGDTRYAFYDRLHALESASPNAIPAAIGALAETGDTRAVEPIAGHLESDDPAVREAAIDALLSLDAVEPLFALLEDTSTATPAQLQAADALASHRTGRERLRALEYLVATESDSAAVAHLEAIATDPELVASEDAREAVEAQLAHPQAPVRAAAARLLGQMGSEDSLPAIAAAARAESDPDAALALDDAALSLMSSLPARDVQDYADHRNPLLRRAAFRALGELAREGGSSQTAYRTLMEGLESDEAVIRGAAVLGLSAWDSDDAFNAIIALADDSNPDVRRDVARALGRYRRDESRGQLLRYRDDPNDEVVAAAVASLGEMGDPELLLQVIPLTESRSARVRAAACLSAAKLSTPEVEQAVIDTLMGATHDNVAEVRAASAEALSRFSSELAVLGLSPLLQDRSEEVRLTAIAAVGRTGQASGVGVLSSLLQDPLPEIRIAALHALGELGSPEAVPTIEAALETESDPAVVRAAGEAIDTINR
jgi:HEAT repeat protein